MPENIVDTSEIWDMHLVSFDSGIFLFTCVLIISPSLLILQEVLLHHPVTGPRVSLPERMETRPARGHVENFPAHVWRANPHAGGATPLLRGHRLVWLHVTAVHGLSVQPGE